jgi:hypothetical protein
MISKRVRQLSAGILIYPIRLKHYSIEGPVYNVRLEHP